MALNFARKKFYYTLAYMALCSGIYFFTNTYQFFPEIVIVPGPIDNAFSYIPWMNIVYYTYFVLMFLPLLICDDESMFFRLWLAYIWVCVISGLIFFFFPTRCSWPHEAQKGYLNMMCLVLKSIEKDFNACPSMHVSLSLTGALSYLWHRKYKRGAIFFIWACAIAISTLGIKRHFFIDVVGAFIMTPLIVIAVNARKKDHSGGNCG